MLKSCRASPAGILGDNTFGSGESDWQLEGRQKRCGRSGVLVASPLLAARIYLYYNVSRVVVPRSELKLTKLDQ